jgi:hypothetical protein
MSLKPQSLRVGNSVFFDGRPDIIEEVSKDGHVYCEKNKFGVLNKEVTPIPLNNDRVVNLGFSKQVNNIFYSEDERFSVEIIDKEFVFFMRTVDFFGQNPEDLPMATVKYVHQLQNAFYFSTWEEITILDSVKIDV